MPRETSPGRAGRRRTGRHTTAGEKVVASVAQLGRQDIVAADIGVACYEPAAELDETTFAESPDSQTALIRREIRPRKQKEER
ncbi:MAG TPA: hypothetical protein VG253_18400 [Streptosporangiaceae bacterium]|nr:hypothetical protein [Streptosporangiaceae bacterium]